MSEPGPPIRPRSVYVHVPFCTKRCHYCDFSVARAKSPPIDAYVDAVGRDLDQWWAELELAGRLDVDTIFIGGGTPSLLGADGMRRLAGKLEERFDWDAETVEWTAEANPRSLTSDVCEAWRELGINRVSLGVQSFQDGPLEWLGRLHDAAEASAAVRRAREGGFERINIDLIFGLPADVERDWPADVDRACELGVTHVSAYGLTAEPRTPLGRWVDLGRVRMPDGTRYAREYGQMAALLTAAGFEHYEVSNFARDGHASAHNWHYWDGSEYLGLGPSAHSQVGGERTWNVNRWDRYRRAAEAGESLREGRERPDAEQRRLERIWLGLRTSRGLPWKELAEADEPENLTAWREAGWLTSDAEGFRLTTEGWLRLDQLSAEIASWDPRPSGASNRV